MSRPNIPDAEAFLVQVNPRVSTQFTGHGSRVLHALEAQTGTSFLFEGSEGLALDHFAITFMGTRAEVEERALPFRQGDEVLVDIVEPHMYDVDDAVAKIDGYIISIAGAASCVGEKRMVRINEVGRTAASALLLDEAGEVVAAPVRTPGARSASRGRKRATPAREPAPTPRRTPRRTPRANRAPAAGRARKRPRRPAQRRTAAEEPLAEADQTPAADAPEKAAKEPQAASGDDGGEDGLQSKPRRRGRRGGRRRSAAKAEAGPE